MVAPAPSPGGSPAPAAEAAYRAEVAALLARRVRVTAVLAMVIAVLDTAEVLVSGTHPGVYEVGIRLGVIAAALAIFALTSGSRAVQVAMAASVTLALVMAADLTAAVVRTGGAASPYLPGGAILIVALSLFFPYTTGQLAAVCAALWAIFVVPLLLTDLPGQWHDAPVTALVFGGATLCAVVATHSISTLRRSQFFTDLALRDEQARTERLLLNILPAPIAERLKHDEGTLADGFAEVTILFADIVGFTQLSARIEPDELVALLNRVFSEFDALAEKHDLEKIKTIGDCYMVAGGLPEPHADHAAAVAEMALDMRDAIAGLEPPGGGRLDIRVGLNTGPVVAGVIGRKKFIYDLWGDAVNTASRMESHGKPSAIHVTESTHAALADRYLFEDRGTIEVKGKGPMHTYFLTGRKPAA